MQQHSVAVISAYLTKRILHLLRLSWLLILALCVLASCVGYWQALRSYRPVYEAQALVSLTIRRDADLDLSQANYYTDRYSVSTIGDVYSYFVSSAEVQAQLKREMGGRAPASVRMKSISDTNMFILSATGTDLHYMVDSINAVLQVFPRIARDVVGPNVLKVIEPPSTDAVPINSLSWKYTSFRYAEYTLIACLAFICLAALRGSRRLVSAQQISEYISAPCLSHLPYIRKQRKKGQGSAASLLLLEGQGDARYADAMNRLRIKVMRALREKNGNTVMITSSLPGEGKSTVSVNLALSLAKSGKRVLVVDADLRATYLKELLDLKAPSEGLAEILQNNLRSLKFLQVPNTSLYLLAGDLTIANPTPLLKHSVVDKIMELAKRSFDYVVIDTPPCVMMADAAFFARYADTTVYVLREDYLSGAQLREGFSNLENAYSGVCGYVLNMSDRSGMTSGGSYYGGSNYYSGSSYSESSK